MEVDNKYRFISDNINRLRETVIETADKYSRKPEEITIIAVTKFHSAEEAQAAVISGINNLGENRTAEMLDKMQKLNSYGIYPQWHMIGTLQSKKVKEIVGKVDMIHSVDSISLLNEISARSVSGDVISRVLLELNVSGEDSKHGFPVNVAHLEEIVSTNHHNLEICGIMTMAPLTPDINVLSNVFESTQEIFMRLKAKAYSSNFNVLSMGMSNDFATAIKYGTTHIRIGTAIFGQRG